MSTRNLMYSVRYFTSILPRKYFLFNTIPCYFSSNCKMASALRYDERVVVVTGAGAGLGRAYALLFASRGASVVVNDLGGSRSGDGKGTNAADTVVNEIKAKGGKAVPNYNSVVDGEKIIQTAIDSFGRVDVVVNNAGILRDRSFAKLSKNDWDLIQDVHLKGAFSVTQAAWPYFRKQKYGRIIVTSSIAGICGNFGQANYSAAKLALVGLSNTLAIEGGNSNIHCNVLVPTAASRLTEDILPPELFNELKPELIAPVVVWLCHESCDENGSIIETAAGWATKIQFSRGSGTLLRKSISDIVTPEDVSNKWSSVIDMSQSQPVSNIQESTVSLLNYLEKLKEAPVVNGSSHQVEDVFQYGFKEVILYALGIGATTTVPSDLKYLYESHEDFSVFPTFAIIPGITAVMTNSNATSAIPNKSIDLSQILHGEQYMEIMKPLPSEGKLITKCNIVDVVDKGKGALLVSDADTYDEEGNLLIYNQTVAFVVGGGNFGGKSESNEIKPIFGTPNRKPDAVFEDQTILDQAAIYRLSGDLNPLHIDPNFSIIAGYKTPILHGLCFLGFAVRHVLYKFANNDPSKFKAVKVRFAKPVFPGQKLKTEMWKENLRIFFRTSVIETNECVLTGGYVDLHEVQSSTEKINLRRISSQNLRSAEIFNQIQSRINSEPSLVEKINANYLYKIMKNGKLAGTWFVSLKGTGKVIEGGVPNGMKADTTLTLEDDDFVDLLTGKLKPELAFLKGKLKIQGNIALARKLQALSTTHKL